MAEASQLRHTEIDTMFLATLVEGDPPESIPMLIAAEAKKSGQRILDSQIIRQVEGAFGAIDSMSRVLRIAMTSVSEGTYVAEFQRQGQLARVHQHR